MDTFGEEGILQFALFMSLCFCVAKAIQGIWERFLCANNCNYNS